MQLQYKLSKRFQLMKLVASIAMQAGINYIYFIFVPN